MANSKKMRKRPLKHVLKLPDLEQSRSAVLNSLTSRSSQRTYEHAIRTGHSESGAAATPVATSALTDRHIQPHRSPLKTSCGTLIFSTRSFCDGTFRPNHSIDRGLRQKSRLLPKRRACRSLSAVERGSVI